MHEEFNQTSRNSCFDDGLDLIIGTIGKIGDGPASIDEDFVIKHVDKLGQDGKGRVDLGMLAAEWRGIDNGRTYRIPIRLRSLATAEIAQSPRCVAQHTEFASIGD